MRGAYCCRAVASVDRLCPKVKIGRKKRERGDCESKTGRSARSVVPVVDLPRSVRGSKL